MPQLQWGGLSEHWLLKELGDMHWTMITTGLGTASDKLMDSAGERLYASFVRLRWEATSALRGFAENESISVDSRLSRFGSKMFFSDVQLEGAGKQLRASLMSVFSARSAQDNTTLKKGAPVLHQDNAISKHDALPLFASEFLAAKKRLLRSESESRDEGSLSPGAVELAGKAFSLASRPVWTKEYVIDPFDDVNGVGLLYFASYPKIADRCERLFAQEQGLLGEAGLDWAMGASCVARDIYYFANANPGDVLSYVQHEPELFDDGRLGLSASLYRQRDRVLIARIFSVKELSGAVVQPRSSAQSEAKFEGGAPVAADGGGEGGATVELPSAGRDELRAFIVALFAAALRLPTLEAGANLNTLGVESILYAELAEALHGRYGLSVSPARFFGLGSIEAIVDDVLGAGGEPGTSGARVIEAGRGAARPARDEVAIIGCCFRLPGAADKRELWELLRAGGSAIGEVPSQRWQWPASIDPQGEHAGISRGGFVADLDSFDAAFFRQAPRSARSMDPQQRWLLEMTWQLFEGAGYSPDEWRGSRTGVFIGASGSDYERLLEAAGDPQLSSPTGTSAALLANHLSYFYDLHGPSLLLDSACSSSLVALHQAVQAIRRGECDAAITGGVHLMCHPGKTVTYHQSNMLSRAGACRTFDARADGYVRAEGAVLFLLKPLSSAVRDGDTVLAVVKGSAVNHGGQVEGLTVPNPELQAALVVAAGRDAGIDLGTISHIEAHGTGTPLGDPIEVNGLRKAFRTSAGGNCSLSSIKANLGHLEAAAGAAGLVKVLLAMEHRHLPPLAGFETINPNIELAGSGLRIQARGEDWVAARPGVPLRAGVSSFGIGGSNAHVIVEEPPARAPRAQGEKGGEGGDGVGGAGGPVIFVLSARTERALHAHAEAMLAHLRGDPDLGQALNLAQVTYALQTARRAMEERLAFVCADREELLAGLQAFVDGATPSKVHRGRASGGGDDVALLREEPELLARWMRQGRLEQVAKYWCRGVEVAWAQLHAGRRYPRLGLPTYPFEKARHWVNAPEAVPAKVDPRRAAVPVVPVAAPVVVSVAASVAAPAISPVVPVAAPVVAPVVPVALPVVALAAAPALSAADCRQILISILAKQLYLEEDEVARAGSFSALGVDSVLGVELAKAASARLGRKVAASSIYTFATIDALAAHLSTPLFKVEPAKVEPAQAPPPKAAAKLEPAARPVVTLRAPEAWVSTRTAAAPAPAKVVLSALPASRPAVVEERVAAPAVAAPPEPERSAAPSRDAIAQVMERVRAMVCEQLYLEPSEVSDDQAFGELGLDSVLAADFVKKINATFAIRIKTSELYVHSTIRTLSAQIAAKRAPTPPTSPAPPTSTSPTPPPTPASPPTPPTPPTPPELTPPHSPSRSPRAAAPAVSLAPLRVEGDWEREGTAAFTFPGAATDNPYLAGHWVFGRSVMPTDGYLEMVYAAICQCTGARGVSFQAARIYKPFIAGPEAELRVVLQRGEAGAFRFSVSSRDRERDEVLHVRGKGAWTEHPRAVRADVSSAPAALRSYSTEEIARSLRQTDVIGCYFQVRRSLSLAKDQGWGQLRIDAASGVKPQSRIAQVLDGALLFAIQHAAFLQGIPDEDPCLYLPYQLEELYVLREPVADVAYDCRVRCEAIDGEAAQFSLQVYDAEGEVLLQCRRLVLRRIEEARFGRGPAAEEQPSDGEPPADGEQRSDRVPSASAPARDLRVAIVGMSCRLPGARNAPELWDVLRRGVDPIEEIDARRWGEMSWFHDDARHAGTSYSRWGGFIADSRGFDPLFFGISPFEAELMTPEQRVFLQECWNALEDGGIDATTLERRKVGVFAGAGASDYTQVLHAAGADRDGAVFVGASQAILAARISYFLNLTGPALAIETACSSSLVAVDRAVKSLQAGECELALAGGVALLNTPQLHIWTSQVGMPSPDGRCKTFDDGANGIVSSEGVGVIALKRLADAERDGDLIHAVIAASGVNQDGKTNGITAPNAVSQYELMIGLYREHGIDPSTIGYVEAHGTGTKLGDPIEVSALVRAFRELTEEQRFCALGSVKSHIGHCSHAAGISGLMKAVLLLEREQIAPGLHFQQLNDEIELEGSPFYIPAELQEWKDSPSTVRRAAVSSFGFSGTNAHVVLEAYPEARRARTATSAGPYAIVLSAKTAKALHLRARRLLDFLEREDVRVVMSELAGTLQLGRAAMEARAAALVRDEAELRALLSELASGDARRWKAGQVRQARGGGGGSSSPSAARDWEEALTRWVAGDAIAWASFYGAAQPRRVSLPGYPFANDPYWVAPKTAELASPGAAPRQLLHPLLHERCSAAQGFAFASAYTGDERFLRDHVVRGAKVLAGAAYLELLREAGARATGRAPTRLQHLTWRTPLIATEAGCAIRVELSAVDEAGRSMHAEVRSADGGRVFATATLDHGASDRPTARPPRLALESLRVRLSERRTKSTHYAALVQKGFALGPSFQGVQERFFDEREVLARVSLPRVPGFAYAPGMIDSCFQACLGWAYEAHGLPMALPFSVRELELFAELPETVWVHARKSPGHDAQGWSGYDLQVVDEAGDCCLSCAGFVFLPVPQEHGSDRIVDRGAALQVRRAVWIEEPRAATAQATASIASTLCLLAPELPGVLGDELRARGTGEVQRLVAGAPEEVFLQVLERLRDAAAVRRPLSLTVLCADEELPRYRFLSGLFKTAALEHGALAGKVLAVEGLDRQPAAAVAEQLRAERGAPDVLVRIAGDRRLVPRWRASAAAPSSVDGIGIDGVDGIEPGGAYLITGGGGGIGQLLVALLCQARAVPIVVGRRARDVAGAISYACDLTSREEVARLVRRIEDEHGGLRGVFHLAGVCRDSLLLRKTHQEAREVFAPKVSGVVTLDEATRHLRLKLFVLFSSIAAVEGNVGQADYAAANAWMDGFAEERAREVAAGRRWGKTVSLNWPLWAEGGMSIDAETLRALEQRWGMRPMPTAVAWQALQLALADGGAHYSVRYGDAARGAAVETAALAPSPVSRSAVGSATGSGSGPAGAKELAAAVAAVVSRVSKVPPASLDAEEELGAYGFDSILLTKLANELNEAFGLSLLPTVFFNHPTLARLTAHLVERHGDALRAAVRMEEPLAPPLASSLVQATAAPEANAGDEPIAVIGMSGRFPGSPDLDAFWDHLLHERDLITEVPAERWRWQDLYGDPAPYANKTRANQGGFLTGAHELDAMFFSISPLEAALMDPQHRLLLETTYHALEDAGLPPGRLRGSDTGVFVGISGTDYAARLKEAGKVSIAQFATGNAHCMAANRLSYWFDWHGPSEPIDTACSSSLVALHRAATSLRRGECKLAVAGGVNLLASADLTLSFSQAGMLSGDGRCKTFDSRADGYVRGEGVGVVVLKPLGRALADGDPIHAVIRSSAQNHGGKANTLTSPNPNAQRDLLVAAYAPLVSELHRLCYLEAHGTGTSLGDPIEVEALSMALAELERLGKLGGGGTAPEQREPCGLGSVKTNIGHLEAAAGIAGFLKLVLVLRHGVVPGNPHLRSANPYLRYDERRLRIETRTRTLPPATGPRLGGVSSFGFGGANAHVVVESFAAPARRARRGEARPALVPLSGKDAAALERQVARLIAHLDGASDGASEVDLHDLAYTLQVGRDAHKERGLWVASSIAELRAQLVRWRAGERVDEAEALRQQDEAAQGAALAWRRGEAVAWEALHAGLSVEERPRRSSAPGYAFERVPYWISPEGGDRVDAPASTAAAKTERREASPARHPLLHREVAGGERARFASDFAGTEAFFLDHRVAGTPVLPGAAQLEWVREAVHRRSGRARCSLHEVVFLRPIAPGARGVEVELTLSPVEHGFRFELRSEEQVFSEGRVSLDVGEAAVERIDPEALRRDLPHHLSGAAYYELLHRKGIDYGGAFRGIQSIHHGGAQTLARIEAPVDADCALSPNLLDSAVQTVMGLAFEFSEDKPTCLPFSVRAVRIHAPLPSRFWSYARRRPGRGEAALAELDVHVFDDSGQLLVELEGFTARPLAAAGAAATSSTPVEPVGAGAADLTQLLYVPVWQRSPFVRTSAAAAGREALLISGHDRNPYVEPLSRALRQRGQRVRVQAELLRGEPRGDIDLYLFQGLQTGSSVASAELALFRSLKQLLAESAAMDSVNVTVLTGGTQSVLPSDAVAHHGSGIVGLVGAFKKEQPRWKIRLVDLELAGPEPEGLTSAGVPILDALWRVPYDSGELHALRRGRSYHKRLTSLAPDGARPSKLRHGGTYVILGGAGGLGRVTTQYLLRRYQANVVWLGRRPHDESVAAAIRSVACGARAPAYLQCDAVDVEQVRAAYRQIQRSFGAVHGLFHSALVLSDRYVRSMTEQELMRAFEPKAGASENLVEVFGEAPLDFFCFYSSLQAHVQAAGQGNYAAGCTYGDSFAKAAARRRSLPVRIINWGYWGEVGVVASEDYRERVRAMGLDSISPDEGMAVLESVLGGELREVTAARFCSP